MPIWATHPKPKEDELLSSWLIRIASECGMSATGFCSEILSIKNPNLRIVDRSPDDLLLKVLSEGTGVPVERIRETSLLAEEGYVFSQNGQGSTRWIIPAVTVHTTIRQYTNGMAYCPECLHADSTPYYRKSWRYAFYTICTTHRRPLRSSCPHCDCPYSHMQPVAKKLTNVSIPITSCWSCGGDVRITTPTTPWGGDLLNLTLSIQKNILAGIDQGTFNAPSHGYVNSRTYLDVLYCVIRSLAAWIYGSDRMKHVGRMSGIEFLAHRANLIRLFGDTDIETRQAEDRAILLCLANWLMGEWPTRLVTYAEKSKLNYSKLFAGVDESYWFSVSPVPLSSNQSVISTPSNEEIASATNVLRRRMHRAVSKSEVHEFMVNGTLGSKIQKQIAAKKSAREWHQKFAREWKNDLLAAKNKRLSKIITWSQSKKFMEKIEREHAKEKTELNADDKGIP